MNQFARHWKSRNTMATLARYGTRKRLSGRFWLVPTQSIQLGWIVLLLFCQTSIISGVAAAQKRPDPPKPDTKLQQLELDLVDCRKIWDAAPHNAFTDLVRWRDRFYCAFREGQRHAGDVGKLRILESADGTQWQSASLLEMDGLDLRDAALSITPDNRLMVMGGMQRQVDGVRTTGTFVCFSEDGELFTQPQAVSQPGRWLWRVTWRGNAAFGVSYATPAEPESSSLLSTSNGVDFDTVVENFLDQGGRSTEARVRFSDAEQDKDTAYCLHRRDGNPNSAYLGSARPPYEKWQWKDLGVRIGGPNMIQLPDGRWLGAGRLYDGGARTELFEIDVQQGSIQSLLRLPSGGDTSYPGLVWHDNLLWVSYYASHEGKTSIYLARVQVKGLE